MGAFSDSRVRCGIVLAAGEGQRLRPFIRQVKGDFLPKQYVNFIGTRSMLEHTFYRAEKLIPADRIFTVVSQEHLRYGGVRRQLSGRPKATVISQPQNKDTGPGVLLPLMHLYKRFPESTVALFPSDHFIVEEDLFMLHVALAFQMVEQNPHLLVLLGMKPDEPEPEYGYIVPDGKTRGVDPKAIRRVGQFVEKPSPDAARELILQGALWNTMVIIFRTQTLFSLAGSVAPELYGSFQTILKAIGSREEEKKVKEVYRHIKPMNFSKGLLEVLPLRYPWCLSVLPVHGVFWSDWGLPRSVESVLRKTGYVPRLHSHDTIREKRTSKSINGG